MPPAIDNVHHPPSLDPRRLLSETSLAQVEHLPEVDSTQDQARRLAADAKCRTPLLIVADRQTAGRGRGTNRWWSGAGSLAFSLVFDPANWNLAPRGGPQRSLAVAVALVDTVRPLLPAHPVGLHWPNDIFVGVPHGSPLRDDSERKLAGILLDVLSDGRHVVGIGLNTNNSLAGAPEEVVNRATTINQLTGQSVNHTDLLIGLCTQLERSLRQLDSQPQVMGARFDQLCTQHGRMLTIDVGGTLIRGRCAGIAPDGALLLETDGQVRPFYCGSLR